MSNKAQHWLMKKSTILKRLFVTSKHKTNITQNIYLKRIYKSKKVKLASEYSAYWKLHELKELRLCAACGMSHYYNKLILESRVFI